MTRWEGGLPTQWTVICTLDTSCRILFFWTINVQKDEEGHRRPPPMTVKRKGKRKSCCTPIYRIFSTAGYNGRLQRPVTMGSCNPVTISTLCLTSTYLLQTTHARLRFLRHFHFHTRFQPFSHKTSQERLIPGLELEPKQPKYKYKEYDCKLQIFVSPLKFCIVLWLWALNVTFTQHPPSPSCLMRFFYCSLSSSFLPLSFVLISN
jgi:hypothetical protein